MTQKPRGEYEMEIDEIAKGNMHTDAMKTNKMLTLVTELLLDIRELLANPVRVQEGNIMSYCAHGVHYKSCKEGCTSPTA